MLEWVDFPQRYKSNMGHVQKKLMSSSLHFSLVTDLVTNLVTQMVAYLEWPNHQLKDQLHFCFEIVREESKHDVVNAKERDQQQGGLGQPPVGKTNMSHEGRGKRVRGWGILQLNLEINPENVLFFLVPQTADCWWFQTWSHHKMFMTFLFPVATLEVFLSPFSLLPLPPEIFFSSPQAKPSSSNVFVCLGFLKITASGREMVCLAQNNDRLLHNECLQRRGMNSISA